MSELPNGWIITQVAEIGVSLTGNTPPKSDGKNYGTYIPFVKPPELINGIVSSSEDNLSKSGVEKSRVLPPNSILVSCIGNLGRTGINRVPVAFNQQINAITPFNGMESKFVFYQAQSWLFRRQLEDLSTATTIAIVNKGNFQKINFHLAPTNEQKRIVAKIEELFSELDKGIESLKTVIEQLKVYRQAVLKHAFEGKLTADWREKNGVSGEWEVAEIGKCGKWQGGGTPSKSVSEYWENGNILWVSPKDMKSRYINNTQQKITEEGVENSPAKKTLDRAVLFVVRSGILRRILPVAMAVSGVTVNQDMQAVVPSRHTVEFMYWYCEAHEQDIRHECSKDGTTVESIEVAELKKFPIPVPSLEEQKEVVKEIETQISVIEQIEYTIESELAKSESLRQAILKKAFSGELVAQDPNDEPANVLLERIRAEKESQSPQRKTKSKGRAA